MFDLSETVDTIEFFSTIQPFGCSIEETLDYETLLLIEELEDDANS